MVVRVKEEVTVQSGVEIAAVITNGCKAIHSKSSNEFIALIDRHNPVAQKCVRVKATEVDVT